MVLKNQNISETIRSRLEYIKISLCDIFFELPQKTKMI